MVEHARIVAVLAKRFPEATPAEMADAANAIVALPDEWEEVTSHTSELGYHSSPRCSRICYLAQQVDEGDAFRLFRRRARR